jgi:hypothetical protein
MKKVRLTFNRNEFFYLNQVPSNLSWSTSVLQGLIVKKSGFVNFPTFQCLACMLEILIFASTTLNLLVQTKVPSYYLSHLLHLFHTQVVKE